MMGIPSYSDLMLPMLKICKDDKGRHNNELENMLANQYNLTEEERNRLLPSGRETYIQNRTGWAAWHLKKAGLVTKENGLVQITNAGKNVLKSPPLKST